ncbi:MAG: ATP-binding protein [Candidatus Magasanikbacteria bacterium]|nr:ATP-binding protein [Candidatus Magasanikbacteria bacterium]
MSFPQTILKDILLDQQRYLTNEKKSIRRDLLGEISTNIFDPTIVVITGLRRVGKSTLLRQIMNVLEQDSYYYCNFEDERFLDFKASNFSLLLQSCIELFGERKTIFFDEVQNISGWERFVRRLHDSGYKCFITGSNASLLSRELGTKLTGRYVAYTLYPFSFSEYLRTTNNPPTTTLLDTTTRANLSSLFSIYSKDGGMPEYIQYKNPDALKTVYDSVLYRDIMVRYNIRDERTLRELSLYCMSNIGSKLSYTGVQKMFELGSPNTVHSYVNHLEQSYLLFLLRRYDPSLKKQLRENKKCYSIDPGLAGLVGFRFSENSGRMLENIIYLELLRRKKEVYFYITDKKQEIDFITREGKAITGCVQVSWEMEQKKTKNREILPLIQALRDFNLQKGTIITSSLREEIKTDGKTIECVPAYEWLLRTDK